MSEFEKVLLVMVILGIISFIGILDYSSLTSVPPKKIPVLDESIFNRYRIDDPRRCFEFEIGDGFISNIESILYGYSTLGILFCTIHLSFMFMGENKNEKKN